MASTSSATSSPPGDQTPFSSSSASSHCNSPSLDTGLSLDPSDPLNLLLKSAGDVDSSEASPPDWAELSSLWTNQGDTMNAPSESPNQDMKATFAGDFMDFGSGMAIDPSALHFDPNTASMATLGQDGLFFGYNQPYPAHHDLLGAGQFPFTFHPPLGDHTSSLNLNVPQGRRLSVSSSSSSSGASLSPIIEHKTPVPSSVPAPKTEESSKQTIAEELAQLVRQSAGVLLAVPMSSQIGGHGVTLSMPLPQPMSDSSDGSPSPHASSPAPSSSSAASTPPPTTPPSSHGHEVYHASGQMPINAAFPSQSGRVVAAPAIGVNGRPKTSHTTIERRYRTNLNARILSLRMAVPALRVLERNKGAKGAKKITVDITTGVQEKGIDDGEEPDVVDDRGFVDGVRVVRKCSKANVLGKAVEYIRVLKKRERRLKNEKDGLRALLSGLVGGPALLREWEREWAAKFGGPEADELTESEIVVRIGSNSNANTGNGGSDGEDDEDDDGDGDDDGSDDEGGRKRKKVKVAKAPKAAAVKKEPRKIPEVKIQPLPPAPGSAPLVTTLGVPPVVPEKRKRGRPRKNPLPVPALPVAPPATAPPMASHSVFAPAPGQFPDMMMVDQQSQQPQGHTQQYLLATFALFSFFNSPLTSSFSQSSSHSPDAHHTGHVLNPLPALANAPSSGWTWQTVLQTFHLLVSVLVFASIVVPWLPPKSQRALATAKTRIARLVGLQSTPSIAHAPEVRDDRTKPAALAEALAPSRRGTSDEEVCLRTALALGSSGIGLGLRLRANKDTKAGFEHKGLEQRAWVRLGEIAVLAGPGRTPLWTRLQIYFHMRSHLPWHSASLVDLSTLALLTHDIPLFGRNTATNLWNRAREKAGISTGSGVPAARAISSGLVGGPRAREFEKLALGTLTVAEAASRLAQLAENTASLKDRCMFTPLGALASQLVKERVRRHLQVLFVSGVSPAAADVDEPIQMWDGEAEKRDREDRRRTVDAARSLGGRLADLGDILERVCAPQVDDCDEASTFIADEDADGPADSLDAEIQTLLSALLLYRKIFPSAVVVHTPSESGSTAWSAAPSGNVPSILLSPPSSVSSSDDEEQLVYSLRRALGSTVFESSGDRISEPDTESEDETAEAALTSSAGSFGGLACALEDARDRVVDMLVDCERAGLHQRFGL
ncbi:hypothetical protein HGRIS_000275 [Hohenbuehelia grisea]|uniref:BHLH domain-containing protein n=1 Tax=Hohenbuehelia grisea TaxID=104357 RepID=A0ABR3JS52_9AGAR